MRLPLPLIALAVVLNPFAFLSAVEADEAQTTTSSDAPVAVRTAAVSFELPPESEVIVTERAAGMLYVMDVQRRGLNGEPRTFDAEIPPIRFVQSLGAIGRPAEIEVMLEQDIKLGLEALDISGLPGGAITRKIDGVEREGKTFALIVPNGSPIVIEYYAWRTGDDGRVAGLQFTSPARDGPDREFMVDLIEGLSFEPVSMLTPIEVPIAATTIRLPVRYELARAEAMELESAEGFDVTFETPIGSIDVRGVYITDPDGDAWGFGSSFMSQWRQRTDAAIALDGEARLPLLLDGRRIELTIRFGRSRATDRRVVAVAGHRLAPDTMLGVSQEHSLASFEQRARLLHGALRSPPADRGTRSWVPYWIDGMQWTGLPNYAPVHDTDASGRIRGARAHWLLPARVGSAEQIVPSVLDGESIAVRRVVVPAGQDARQAMLDAEADLIARLRVMLPAATEQRSGPSRLIEPIKRDGLETAGRVVSPLKPTQREWSFAVHTAPPMELPDGRLIVHQLVAPSYTRGYSDLLLGSLLDPPSDRPIAAVAYGGLSLPIDARRDRIEWHEGVDAAATGDAIWLRADGLSVRANVYPRNDRLDPDELGLDGVALRIVPQATSDMPRTTIAGREAVYAVTPVPPGRRGRVTHTTFLTTDDARRLVRLEVYTRGPREQAIADAVAFVKRLRP